MSLGLPSRFGNGALNGGLAGSALNQGGGGAIIAWILRTGFWDDAAPWDDTQLWKDS